MGKNKLASFGRLIYGHRGIKAAPAKGEHLLYSFLTTEANAVVAPVHAKAMSVLLLDEEAQETWLTGSLEDALALQRPAPDNALKIVAAGEKRQHASRGADWISIDHLRHDHLVKTDWYKISVSPAQPPPFDRLFDRISTDANVWNAIAATLAACAAACQGFIYILHSPAP